MTYRDRQRSFCCKCRRYMGGKFCGKCGMRLMPPQIRNLLKCKECKQAIDPANYYCPNCGRGIMADEIIIAIEKWEEEQEDK